MNARKTISQEGLDKMRSRYDIELEELNLELIRMGALAETAIMQTIELLESHDVELANKIIEEDDHVDGMARHIESRSMKLIMKQQPVAQDLRNISTALKMITDIERICDQAADIAEIALVMDQKEMAVPQHIPVMGRHAAQMVRLSIDSFVKRDIEIAKKVIQMDDRQDQMFDTVKNELVEIAIQDREAVDGVVDYLLIAKYWERIADHAENIAEWTMFAQTGVHKDKRLL